MNITKNSRRHMTVAPAALDFTNGIFDEFIDCIKSLFP